jgi:DNA-directed RNA polymerase
MPPYLTPCSAEEQPAFMHGYEYIRGKKLGVIKLNSVVDERMARDSIRETLHPRHLPMLVKPLPWEDFDKGGYLTLRCEFLSHVVPPFALMTLAAI